MSGILEHMRNPQPRRRLGFWGWCFYLCSALSMFNIVLLIGEPGLWNLTDGEKTRATINAFGFLFLSIWLLKR